MKSEQRINGQVAHQRRDLTGLSTEQRNNHAIEHRPSLCSPAQPTRILVQHDIPAMMASILNTPVTAPDALRFLSRQQQAADGIPYLNPLYAIAARDLMFSTDQRLHATQPFLDVVRDLRAGDHRRPPLPDLPAAPLDVHDVIVRRVRERELRPFLERAGVVFEWDEVGSACLVDSSGEFPLGVGGVQRHEPPVPEEGCEGGEQILHSFGFMTPCLIDLRDGQRQLMEEDRQEREGRTALSSASFQDFAVTGKDDQAVMRRGMLSLHPIQQGALQFGKMLVQRPEETVDHGLLGEAVEAEVLAQHLAVSGEPLGEGEDVGWSGEKASENDGPEGVPWVMDAGRGTPVWNLS